MEKVFSTNGVEGLLAAVAVALCLNFAMKLFDFLWKLREKKDSSTDAGLKELSKAVNESTIATQKLDVRLQAIEQTLTDIPRLKRDLRRCFAALRSIAGDDWQTIRAEIMEIE